MAPGIKTTLGALVAAVGALTRLVALRLPVAAAYHVAKLARLVEVEVAHYESQRRAFIDEVGVERESTADERATYGQATIKAVPDDKRETFNARITELVDLPVTIAWRPLTLAELGDVDITAGDLLALGALLDMDAV